MPNAKKHSIELKKWRFVDRPMAMLVSNITKYSMISN